MAGLVAYLNNHRSVASCLAIQSITWLRLSRAETAASCTIDNPYKAWCYNVAEIHRARMARQEELEVRC